MKAVSTISTAGSPPLAAAELSMVVFEAGEGAKVGFVADDGATVVGAVGGNVAVWKSAHPK